MLSSSALCRRSWMPRARTRSATARSSWCRSNKPSASAPASKGPTPFDIGWPVGPVDPGTEHGRPSDSDKLQRCNLGGAIAVTLVHQLARLGDAVDRGSGFGVCRHESLEVGFSQHEQPAIGQSRYIRLPRPAGKQGHLSEELATAEPHRPGRQRHLARPGSNAEDGVTPVTLAEDALVRDRKARAQQPGYPVELPFVEAREDVEPFDQAMRVQSDVEAR